MRTGLAPSGQGQDSKPGSEPSLDGVSLLRGPARSRPSVTSALLELSSCSSPPSMLFACDSPTCRSQDVSPWGPPVLHHVSLPQGPSLLPGSFKSSVEPQSLILPGIPCPVFLTGEGRCPFSFPRDSLFPRLPQHGPLSPALPPGPHPPTPWTPGLDL